MRKRILVPMLVALPVLIWIGRSDGQQPRSLGRPQVTQPQIRTNFGAASLAQNPAQVDFGGIAAWVLRKRCAPGYRYTGQSEGCRTRLNMINNDACVGESATEAWWSCSLERPDFSCPRGGHMEIVNDVLVCIYQGEAPPQGEFSCPGGYQVSAGEFCMGEGTYCCRRPENPCGLGAIRWTTVGNEACCDIPNRGPC